MAGTLAPTQSDRSFRAHIQAPPRASPSAHPTAYLVPILVLCVAVSAAVLSYVHFLEYARQLWGAPDHDRNAHYLFGLSLATDLRQGDLKHLMHDLDGGGRVWPPLHGILAGLVLAAGGLDYRLAVLPSLAGWVGAIVFAFLVARRTAPKGGNLAGLAAVLFILVSPAHRAFATEIMLESLGACLTLAALYFYLVAVQEKSVRAVRCLGMALTALFFQKYNYWLLVVFALTAAEVSSRPGACWAYWWGALRAVPWRRWAGNQLRHPLTYPLIGILLVLAFIFLTPGQTVVLLGRPISVRSPHNLVTLAYAVAFLRVAFWWWHSGRGWTQNLAERYRPLVLWHAVPLALWFLWPQRLSYFLWYVSPAHSSPDQHVNVAHGVAYYWRHLTEDYHVGVGSAVTALAAAALTAVWCHRLRAGSTAVLWLALIAGVLTVHHPNQESRYLHTWVAAVWVAAGVALALVLWEILPARAAFARPWLAAGAFGCVALTHLPGLLEPGHAPDAGPRSMWSSTLDLTDYYLPALADSRRAAVLSTAPVKFLAQWTYLERYARRDRLETDVKGFGISPEQNRAAFGRWLATNRCDTLVFIDVPARSYFDEPCAPEESFPLRGMLEEQDVFRPVQRREFREYGCTVSVWKRPVLARRRP